VLPKALLRGRSVRVILKSDQRKPRVVIAGASGFVGRALLGSLGEEFELVGLSRTRSRADLKSCDLFSLKDAEESIAGADVAIYLVHSMMPSSRLTQASFADLDLIAADNFARACRRAGVKQIIYLGGLHPQSATSSKHLESRQEVEDTLRAAGVPLTSLRAGLIIGSGGSSFMILTRLVERLPLMLLPRWTETRADGASIEDVVFFIRFCILNPSCFSKAFDLAFDQSFTYRELIEETARVLGLKRRLISLTVGSPRLSALWVRMVTGAPLALVTPLVESLRYPLLLKNDELYRLSQRPRSSLHAALKTALQMGHQRDRLREMRARHQSVQEKNDVRSIQRLPLPSTMRARDVGLEYLIWLQSFSLFLIRIVATKNQRIEFRFLGFALPLLILELDLERSSDDRSLLRIRGGMLAIPDGRGRLEFREALGGRFVIAAVHDFLPRLPWIIYKYTQAVVHLLVMRAFARHLGRLRIAKPEVF
jgi:uncharacterized protein YbjT (DUF2867 family)